MSQVAGRAGRGTEPGLVIVQTMNPQEAAIRFAAEHDYVSFARGELAVRREAGLPPATRIRSSSKASVRSWRFSRGLQEGVDPSKATLQGASRLLPWRHSFRRR